MLKTAEISNWLTDAGAVDVIKTMPGSDMRPLAYEELRSRSDQLSLGPIVVQVAALDDVIASKGLSELARTGDHPSCRFSFVAGSAVWGVLPLSSVAGIKRGVGAAGRTAATRPAFGEQDSGSGPKRSAAVVQTVGVAKLIRDGIALAYEEAGRGAPALVFVHGLACHRGFWAEQVKHFSRHHRVLAVDLRGHGDSDAPEQRYTMQLLADDVA